LRVDEFDFELPRSLIALQPAEPRDAARLMVVGSRFDDRRVAELPGLLRPGDLMVFNDTKVIPARLVARRGEAVVEITLHRRIDAASWRAFAKGAKRLRVGDHLDFITHEDSPGGGFGALAQDVGFGAFGAKVLAKEEGDVLLEFDRGGAELREALERYGSMPLPPYIKRPRGGDAGDRASYQTVFAAKEGAVAAPTAGLHFTPALLDALALAGIEWLTVTLHVGAGTFLPVKVDDTSDHRMHSETGVLTAEAASRINAARAAGRRIVSVGTTSLRLLESAADVQGRLEAFDAETAIFITPGYRFRVVDVLFTNFHLPRSTLFMLTAAFGGLERMRAGYAHAMEQGYRFFSYGDACLIEKEDASS